MKKTVVVMLTLSLVLLTMLPMAPMGIGNTEPPEVLSFTINGQNNFPFTVAHGRINYDILIHSHSHHQFAKVDFYLMNTFTGEKSVVFSDHFLENGQINYGGTFVQAGNWLAQLVLQDSYGVESVYEYPFSVVEDTYTDYRIVEVSPNPILVDGEKGEVGVRVIVQNLIGVERTADISWRWADEKEWQDTVRTNFESVSKAEKGIRHIFFMIDADLKDLEEREIIFAVNPFNTPEGEEIEERVTVKNGRPDLIIDQIVYKGFDGHTVTVDYLLKQEVENVLTDTIITHLQYGADNIAYGSQANITIGTDNAAWVRGVSIPYHGQTGAHYSIFGHVNFTADQPINEADFDNNREFLNLDLRNKLNFYASHMTGGIFRQGSMVTTVVTVGMSAGSPEVNDTVDVVLRKDGEEIGRRSIYLQSGEEREIIFTWMAPVDRDGNVIYAILEAEINPEPRKYLNEVTTKDNKAFVTVTLMPGFDTTVTCPPSWNNTSAVSGSRDYLVCDDQGNCWVETEYYYEHASAYLSEPTRSEVKAGMGFGFTLETRYYNEFSASYYPDKHEYDFKRIYADFPEVKGVELVPERGFPSDRNTWHPPRAKITNGQGDMEMIERIHTLYPLNIDKEAYTDGGNIHYTSFYLPDGNYSFTVNGRNGGVDRTIHIPLGGGYQVSHVTPRLAVCVEGSVNINGSPHDDYIVRRIDPNVPFPIGGRHGWNWAGKVHIIEGIADWWSNYGRGNYNIGQRKFIVDLTQEVDLN